MSITFKTLNKDDYLVEPYIAKAAQTYYVVSGSLNNPSQVTIDVAEDPPTLWPSSDEAAVGFTNDSGRYTYHLWKSLLQTLYWPSASIDEVYDYYPSESVYIISMATEATGDGIFPGSFIYTQVGSGASIIDDRNGNLYLSGSPSVILGTIQYSQGIAVIQRDSAASPGITSAGVYFNTVTSSSVHFKSTTTIFQHTVYCTLTPADFNFTLNRTAELTVSEWNSGSGMFDTGSLVYDMFDSGSIMPYFTTVGMYDQQYNLIAVAKVANPIPRSAFSDQTIVVKFDT